MRKNDNQNGYSIIELVISVTVVSILTLAVGTFFVNATIAWTRNNTETQLQAENQLAIDAIKKDINSANGLALFNDNEISLYVPALNAAGIPLYVDASKISTCKNTVHYQFDSNNLYRYVTANTSSGCNAAAGNVTSDSTTTLIQGGITANDFNTSNGSSSCSSDIYTCNNISVNFTRQKSQFGKTYSLTSATTASLAQVDPIYLEYYFDISTSGSCDPQLCSTLLAWDGSPITYDTWTAGGGSGSSVYSSSGSTSAPTSGGNIVSVEVRIRGGLGSGGTQSATVYESGTLTSLGTATLTGSSGPGAVGSYTTLSQHSGGWTWSKIKALDTRAYRSNSALGYLNQVEVRVRVI